MYLMAAILIIAFNNFINCILIGKLRADLQRLRADFDSAAYQDPPDPERL